MSKIQQTQQTHAQPAAKANKPQQAHKLLNVNAAQMLDAPETMRAEDVLAAQQQVGNQVVQRALDKDARRKRLTDEQGNLAPEITSQIQQKRGGGSPLPENIQKEAAKKLGRSFKDVRIHTDESADTLSRTINARAFTIGKDIFFKNGVFAPGSGAGRETIIHELTHVVQQGGGKGGASGALKLGGRDTAQEKEADRMGKKHAAAVSAAPAGAVQREAEEDELLQAQQDEEELQMQPAEEDELQMQGDDDIAEDAPAEAPDDLMLQEDEEELQMQPPEEDELQMQPAEEDELQMQPDISGTIQRIGFDPEELKARATKMQQKVSHKGAMKEIPQKSKSMDLGSEKHLGKLNKLDKNPDLSREKLHSQLKKKAGAMKLGSEEHQEKLSLLEHDRDYKNKSLLKEEQKAGKMSFLGASIKDKKDKEDAAKDPKQVAKQKWMATLKDPKASKEDIAKAKERLGTFHKDVGKKDFKAAKAERRTSLEEAAKSGDDDAYEKWQSERKKTKGEKAKSFFKSAGKKMGSGLLSAGKWAGGKALGFAKKQVNSGVDHFLGTKSDDKDDDKASVNVVNNIGGAGGSAGGGGVGAVMEKYSEVLQENKKLKEELAGLKKTA